MTVTIKAAADDADVFVLDDAAAPADDVPVIDESARPDGLPERAVRNADGSITLPLLFPRELKYRISGADDVKVERFEDFRLHRLSGADMRAISSASKETMLTVAIARSAKVMDAKMSKLFDILDAEDASAASQVVGYFLGGGKTTGR